MYTFSYDNCDINVVEPSVKMTVRSEPDVDQLLEFFQRFLVASGHIFDEDERLEVVKKEKNPSFSFNTYSELDNTIFVGS